MPYNHKDFEDYLMQAFADEIRFTENDCLDDDMQDAFDSWLCDMEPDDWLKHGEKYAQAKFDYYKQQMNKDGG